MDKFIRKKEKFIPFLLIVINVTDVFPLYKYICDKTKIVPLIISLNVF